MSALDSLIRVNRWQLDERRQQLAQLERLDERLRAELGRLEGDFGREADVARDDGEAARAWAAYAEAVGIRRKTLEASIANVVAQLVVAREALAEAFQDVKRYELAAAARQKKERAVIVRRDQVRQDEVALQIYRRRAS